VPSRYAGRNQIGHAAAGERSEADGGYTRYSGWSESYTLRVGAIGDYYRSCEAAERSCSIS